MIVAAALSPLFADAPGACLADAARRRADGRAIDPHQPLPAGPGWFDSSHDLRAGLTVVEHQHLHGDTLELAVALWLRG